MDSHFSSFYMFFSGNVHSFNIFPFFDGSPSFVNRIARLTGLWFVVEVCSWVRIYKWWCCNKIEYSTHYSCHEKQPLSKRVLVFFGDLSHFGNLSKPVFHSPKVVHFRVDFSSTFRSFGLFKNFKAKYLGEIRDIPSRWFFSKFSPFWRVTRISEKDPKKG